MIGFDYHADMVDEATRAAVRERVVAGGFERFEIADRGRYELSGAHGEAELTETLIALAERQLGVGLAAVAQRWTRLRRGDYALFKDDQRRWTGPGVEVCVDVSAAASQEGQIVYAAPDGGATVPQRPGGVAIVDRRRPMARYERYLGVRFADGEIVRLALALTVCQR